MKGLHTLDRNIMYKYCMWRVGSAFRENKGQKKHADREREREGERNLKTEQEITLLCNVRVQNTSIDHVCEHSLIWV